MQIVFLFPDVNLSFSIIEYGDGIIQSETDAYDQYGDGDISYARPQNDHVAINNRVINIAEEMSIRTIPGLRVSIE